MVPCRQLTGRQDHVATTWQRRAVGDDTCRPVECRLVLSARVMRRCPDLSACGMPTGPGGDDREPIGFWCPDVSACGMPTGCILKIYSLQD